MTLRDPEKNFEDLWQTFHDRYPFFALRNVDWNKQYEPTDRRSQKRPAMMSSSRSSAGCLPR